MYSYLYSEKAYKDLSKLDKQTTERIDNKIQKIQRKPHRFLKWINQYKVYRLRVGDYRAFIDLDEEQKIIHVLTVVKRDRAYKR